MYQLPKVKEFMNNTVKALVGPNRLKETLDSSIIEKIVFHY